LSKLLNQEVEILQDPLSDDYMNLIEVAASVP